MSIESKLEPDFLTIEQTAKFLNKTTDIIITLIEQEKLFLAFAAIPSAPMFLVPKGHEETVNMIFSNPELYSKELENNTEIKSGIFRIKNDEIKSIAINGSVLIHTLWTITPSDYGNNFVDNLNEDERKLFENRCFWLISPIEITLKNIRVPFHYLRLLKDLVDNHKKIKEIESSTQEKQPEEKPLHANERNTLLAIIRTLAELHGIKSGGGAYRKVAASLLLDIANAAIEAPCDEKSLAKHLSASFKAR